MIKWLFQGGRVILFILLPAFLSGALGGWIAPIISARRNQRLWLLQQRLEAYATVVDYASMIFRLVDTAGSRLPHEGQLPRPPQLMEGKLDLLGTFTVGMRWQRYSNAIHAYNVRHSTETEQRVRDLMTYAAIKGNELTAQCQTEMREIVFTRREISGMPRWRHWCHVHSENHPWLKRFVPPPPYDPDEGSWRPSMTGPGGLPDSLQDP